MKTKTVKIEKLKPHSKNPNRHPTKQLEELERSLDQFKQVKNIVVWNDTILAGHGLVEAAKRKGSKTLEAVDVSEWSEEKATSFLLADNRLQELAIMDMDLLTSALKDFESPEEIPGFDVDYLDNVLKNFEESLDLLEEPEPKEVQELRNQVYHGDCLELMKGIPDQSIDMILCDLPYGTTDCSWDEIIPFKDLWNHYNRITKPNSAIALTCAQPFTSALVCSNINSYKHHWVWIKEASTGFQVAKFRPMMKTEDIIVFSTEECKNQKINYYPIKTPRPKTIIKKTAKGKSKSNPINKPRNREYIYNDIFPNNILQFTRDKSKIHPTQKPVALFEYLIKTYTKKRSFSS